MKFVKSTISRKRLLSLADKMQAYKMLYVQAPAGYGKTTFAGQWLKSRKGETSRITFDEYDNNIIDCFRKLNNLLRSFDQLKESTIEFLDHPAFNSAPIEFLLKAADSIPKTTKVSLVIDDLHYITDPEVLRFLPIFIKRLPPETNMVLTSRNALPDPLEELYLKDELMLITWEDLIFSSDEIYELYKYNDIKISRLQAVTIYNITEGWPIGVNAVLLSGNNDFSINLPLARLGTFIKNQVWQNWDENIQEFMIKTSIEEELNKELCCALTGNKNSSEILADLLSDGAFIIKNENDTYRFHRLFREFLLDLLSRKPEAYEKKQWELAGQWYLSQNNFIKAVHRFSKINDYDNIARCFDLLESIDRSGFDLEGVMYAVKNYLDDEITERYPFLLLMLSFTARNDGDAELFTKYADSYYSNYPSIVARNPELAHNIFFLYMLDFRYSLEDIAQMAGQSDIEATFEGVRGTATSYFPLYHRAYRDLSELAAIENMDVSIAALNNVLGDLLGEEREMLIESISGGLYYERGELEKAHTLTLSANSKLKDGYTSESKFCVMMLAYIIYHGLRQHDKAEFYFKKIQNMIMDDKAYYLSFNLDAMTTKYSLYKGNQEAAQSWLDTKSTDIYDHLNFYKLIGHFTTTRAYITAGNFDRAILMASKIVALAESYNRPLDVIEAEILLSIAFWKKKRGYQKEALLHLEKAIGMAHQFQYTQIFTNEGAELESMLMRLKNRSVRNDYKGDLNDAYVKMLYLRVCEQAKYTPGLTGGANEKMIKFTKQQKNVMRLLSEGYSYKKIGEELGIKYSTVRSHIELIYKKLDVPGVKEAVLKIRQMGILEN